jgi:pentapeptide MXKDX repeat protein
MKMNSIITSFAALAFVVDGAMYAGGASAEDTMKSEAPTQDQPTQDHMKGEAMKGAWRPACARSRVHGQRSVAGV